MHMSFDGHNLYNLFILAKYCSKNFATTSLQTIEPMAVFVVKSIVMQSNSHGYGSINFIAVVFGFRNHRLILQIVLSILSMRLME